MESGGSKRVVVGVGRLMHVVAERRSLGFPSLTFIHDDDCRCPAHCRGYRFCRRRCSCLLTLSSFAVFLELSEEVCVCVCEGGGRGAAPRFSIGSRVTLPLTLISFNDLG